MNDQTEPTTTAPPTAVPPRASDVAIADKAADRTRSTAMWLAASSGAVGGALIATLSLGDLRDLSGSSAVWAATGFMVAIVGVLVGLLSMASVLSPVQVSLEKVARGRRLKTVANRESRSWLGGFRDVDSLVTAWNLVGDARSLSVDRELAAVTKSTPASPLPNPGEDVDRLRQMVNHAVGSLLRQAGLEEVGHRWKVAVRVYAAAFLLVALGVLLFAFQESSSQVATDAVSDRQRVIVRVSPERSKILRDSLGADCGSSLIRGIVVKLTKGEADVEVTDEDCAPVVLYGVDRLDLVACPPMAHSSGNTSVTSVSQGGKVDLGGFLLSSEEFEWIC